MAEKQCSTCNATISTVAKFCPECGSSVQPSKKRTKRQSQASARPKKKRPRKQGLLMRALEKVGKGIVFGLDWLLIIFVMPFGLIQLSHWIGTAAAWVGVGVVTIYAIFIFKPKPIPMGSTSYRAKVTCVMAVIAAVTAFYFGGISDELAEFKESDVSAYLQKLREYKGEEKWLAAVKELTPENYAETLRQYDAEAAKAAQQEADEKALEAQRAAEKDAKRRKEEAVNRLMSRAAEYAGRGLPVGEFSFGERWSLSPRNGTLRCELGPVANGTPRPRVLLVADNKTYALNGAALGTGQYEDGRSLAIDGSIQTIRDLIPIGIEMCNALSKEQCGTEAWAYNYAEQAVLQRLKNPADADVSMLNATTVMESCGVWLVKSYVDATNSYGAKIRTHFAAEMTRSLDGLWTAKVLFKE